MELSKSQVLQEIEKIINDSADKKPSDEKIREILEQKGIKIARRTISKYRNLYL